MSEWRDQYTGRLIYQYHDKPNASAEVDMLAGVFEEVYELFRDLPDAYDIDRAVGEQQDVLGRIIGFPRLVPYVVPKVRFGFEQNDNARGFSDLFDPERPSAPFFDLYERAYTDLQLDDETYRFFQRVVVAKNNASAYVTGDDSITIQDAVERAFGAGQAWVDDSLDMTLSLYVSPTFDAELVKIVRDNGLLPAPQGVSYRILRQGVPGQTFGFYEGGQGFADLFDDTREGGVFARLIL